jgi:hypothetical protein
VNIRIENLPSSSLVEASEKLALNSPPPATIILPGLIVDHFQRIFWFICPGWNYTVKCYRGGLMVGQFPWTGEAAIALGVSVAFAGFMSEGGNILAGTNSSGHAVGLNRYANSTGGGTITIHSLNPFHFICACDEIQLERGLQFYTAFRSSWQCYVHSNSINRSKKPCYPLGWL